MLKNVTIILFILLMFCFGCVATQPTTTGEVDKKQQESNAVHKKDSSEIKPIIEEEPETADEPQVLEHIVKWDGETLSLIAKWYTGSYLNWDILAKSNPDIDPNLLYINSKILIPDELVITIESMPKKFVDQFLKKSFQKKNEPNQGSDENENLLLFGPKTNQKE